VHCGAEPEAVIAWWTRIAPSPPPDDGTRPLHPVMLAQIWSPSASARSKLSSRLRPPGAKAAAALVPFRRAPNFIVDEDLSRRRRLFHCQPIAVHQRREAVRSQGSLDRGCKASSAPSGVCPVGDGPGPEGATRNPGRAVPGQSKARQQRPRQLLGFTGAVASTSARNKPASHCLTSCGQSQCLHDRVSMRPNCRLMMALWRRRLASAFRSLLDQLDACRHGPPWCSCRCA
jgi:hypothetical protein